MAFSILSRTFSDAVTVPEAVTHLRIWDDSEDAHVQSLIEAAYDVAERYMNRLVAESTVIVERDTLTTQLPLGKAKSIVSVTYVEDASEQRFVLDSMDYSFNPITNKIVLKRSVAGQLEIMGARDFQITFVTGWSATEVPAAIKQGILMLVGSMYVMPEDAAVGQGVTVTKVPVTHQYLFNKYKITAL
jgi:uncharacterized phiE125 gp8 family phage protein